MEKLGDRVVKKVGVVACYSNYNYGSMLQAYATLVALEKQGYECEFINYQKKPTFLEKVRFVPRFLNKYLMKEKWRLLDKRIRISRYSEIKKGDQMRKAAFRRFGERYYNGKISDPYVGYKALKTSPDAYDAILVGSDQLWFPAGLPTNFYNLMFVPENKRKIAYSTSFGVTEIPFYQISRTKQFLNRIDFLSVREKSGQELIKKLTGRDAKVVLDPTLLLSKEEWADAISDTNVIEGEYIFCYLLGSNEQHRSAVKELAQKTGLRIFDMPHIDEFVPGDLEFADEHLFDVDPAQFVNLIRHAKYVCTDSFHCCVFSIIHHKQFIAFDRYSDALMASRNSRIANLCEICGLESRRYKGKVFEQILEDVDFDRAEKNLAEKRKESFEYLREGLR